MNDNIRQKIEAIFYPYIQLFSKSGTADENLAAAYVHSYFQNIPYFQEHPDLSGSYAIAEDPFRRSVEWALVKGKGQKTVVLLHHFDVVEIDDYGSLQPLAFSPAELERALMQNADALTEEVRADLFSNCFLFGRGTADMKGGGAIQMAIMDELSRLDNFDGNVLLLAVPDEENLSAGARSSVLLMADLKDRYALDYVLMINSEPHKRKDSSIGTFVAGSIGKMMPFVYVRGILSHAGMSQEGFNPLAVLGDIIRRTEMNHDLAEVHNETGQVTPMPTWLMAHDSKTIYDVSMPLSAFGCLNILAFTNRASEVMRALEEICLVSSSEMTAQVNRGVAAYYRINGPTPCEQRWNTTVMTYDAYVAQQKAVRGASFDPWYRQMTDEIVASVYRGEQTTASATWAILNQLTQMDGSHQPLVILGLLPPYYPSVCYLDRPDFKDSILQLHDYLNRLSAEKWGEQYHLEPYIMGVSDLSFSSLPLGEEAGEVISSNMPLFGSYFKIPFRQIAEISMPCINIGPWGRDVHRLTERVSKEDLFVRTPELLMAAIQKALQWDK